MNYRWLRPLLLLSPLIAAILLSSFYQQDHIDSQAHQRYLLQINQHSKLMASYDAELLLLHKEHDLSLDNHKRLVHQLYQSSANLRKIPKWLQPEQQLPIEHYLNQFDQQLDELISQGGRYLQARGAYLNSLVYLPQLKRHLLELMETGLNKGLEKRPLKLISELLRSLDRIEQQLIDPSGEYALLRLTLQQQRFEVEKLPQPYRRHLGHVLTHLQLLNAEITKAEHWLEQSRNTAQTIDLSPLHLHYMNQYTKVHHQEQQSKQWLQLAALLLLLGITLVFWLLSRAREQLRIWNRRLSSEVKMRTAELERAQHQTNSILESMEEGVVVIDATGKVVRANPHFCGLIGRPSEVLLQQHFGTFFVEEEEEEEVFHERILSLVGGRLQRAIQNDQQLQQNCSESLLPMLVVDEKGEVLFSNSALTLLTGWNQTALQQSGFSCLLPVSLRSSHAEMVSAFLTTPVARTMGGNRYLPLQNRNGETIEVKIGLFPLQLDGHQRVVVLLHNPANQEVWQLFTMSGFGKLFIDEQETNTTYTLQHANGEEIPVHLSGAILQHNTHQAAEGAVLVINDLRTLLSAESALRANQAKDEFLASMSHELRTPLAAIIGNTELLAEALQESDLNELVYAIQRAGENQRALVNDILDMSKIESGKFTIEEAPYDLALLLEDLEKMFAIKARDQGIRLRVELQHPPQQQLLGDRQRIGQILINLLGNAIKFTPQGEVSLVVSQLRDTLLFTVTDSGIGMTPLEVDNLFQRFEQADGSISRRFGGSGLGLYISLNLAEMMGGVIDVSSQAGTGSRFQLRIPYRASTLPIETKPLGSQSGEHKQQFCGRVLVAEDTPELQLLEQRILGSLGLEVVLASHGREAVELATSEPFDLILMDMQMPEMDGITATRTLREQGVTTPIVPLTANVMQQHRDAFAAAGCEMFLAKPLERRELQRVLERYLTNPSQQPADTATAVVTTEAEAEVDEELMALFRNAVVESHSKLTLALRERDWNSMREVAHRLKGSALSFGYPDLSKQAETLQFTIDRGENETATGLAMDLAIELAKLLP